MVEKTIRLNPEFMSLRGNVRRGAGTKRVRPPVSNKTNNKTKDMRNKFLKRIKEHQNNISQKRPDKMEVEESGGDEFLEALQYLNKRKTDDKKKDKQKVNNIQTGGSQNAGIVSLPGKNIQPADVLERKNIQPVGAIEGNIQQNVGGIISMNKNAIIVPVGTVNGCEVNTRLPDVFGKEPVYGNLKGGTKPTYRTLKNGLSYQQCNNKTLTSGGNEKNRVTIEIIDKEEKREGYSGRADKLDELKKDMAKKKTSIIKTKHKLGKQNKTGKIGVLIKDRHTRKRVKDDLGKLKQKSMLEIKNYLKKQNLLKGGTDAPTDVLRELYENAMLAGEVTNNNKDTLVHNYLDV